jgi:hypothetical protein
VRRLAQIVSLTLLGLLLVTPAAVAGDNPTGGQGLYGQTNDKIVTYAGFILIAAIPLFLGLMSLLQSVLEKRKKARKAAARASRGPAGGGW